MADAVYSRLSSGPVGVASLVRELRIRWGPEHEVSSVHHFVAEVATCLLDHDNLELGSETAGTFVAWQLDPWDANDRLEAELNALDTFLDDDGRYVFRRKLGADSNGRK